MYFQSANSRNFYTDDELRTMINIVAKEKNLEIPTLNKEEITALSDEINNKFSVDSTSFELIELLKEELSALEKEDRILTLSNVT